MKRFMLCGGVLLLAVLCGCPAQMDPESQQRLAFIQAGDSYKATTKILVAYRQAGKIGDEDWLMVKHWDNLAYSGLRSWHDALATGASPEAAVQQVNAALQELLLKRLGLQGVTP